MPDVYASIESADEAVQERLAVGLDPSPVFVQRAREIAEDPGHMLTLVDRGADTLVAPGRLGSDAAGALKAEAPRRVAAGEFFGHIAYASLIGCRP
jgi:hypothetical protein